LPVQWVNRPHADFRGFAGMIVSGSARVGDRIIVLPSGQRSRITEVFAPDRQTDVAVCGQSVTVRLEDEIDISRGDVIASDDDTPPLVADQFEATVVWLHEQPMLQGRSYGMKLGTQTVSGTVAPIKYKINVNTLEHIAAKELHLNEIAVCNIELA